MIDTCKKAKDFAKKYIKLRRSKKKIFDFQATAKQEGPQWIVEGTYSIPSSRRFSFKLRFDTDGRISKIEPYQERVVRA